MKEVRLNVLRHTLRLVIAVFFGGIAASSWSSNTSAIAFAICILSTMLGLLIADLSEYFLFKRIAPDFHRFEYRSLNEKVIKIWRRIKKIPVVWVVFAGILWRILITFITPNLSKVGINNSLEEGASLSSVLFTLLICAPIFETLFLQVLPIEISKWVTKKFTGKACSLFSIIVSALLFGAEHFYTIGYIFFAFLMGLFLAFFYLYIRRISGKKWLYGFVAVVLFHFFINLLGAGAMVYVHNHPSVEQASLEQRDTSLDVGSITGEHIAVDLGLSVKWATVNLGASFPEDPGYYLSWGQTSPTSDSSFTAYSDSLSMGADGARQLWGSEWRIPTDKELTELRNECIWIWTQYNGYNGYKIQGPSGESIFLPAAGYKQSNKAFQLGSEGRYWSSQLKKDDAVNVLMLGFDSTGTRRSTTIRIMSQSIRPVTP